ncbi:MAG: hypothetical protein RL226_2419 [Bacteroidota bacterium]
MYAVFLVVVALMLVLDLGVLNKKAHQVSTREALVWSLVWISLSMGFSAYIYYSSAPDIALDRFAKYQTAYWIEKALSVDNLFVFLVVFNAFKVPERLLHKVLYWGVIGAVAMRAIFIFGGVGLLKLTYLPVFSWNGHEMEVNALLLVFGIFLIYSGIKSVLPHKEKPDSANGNRIIGFIRRRFNVTDEFDGERFFTVKNGVKFMTPLFLALLMVEFTDLLFAVDSIPAVFAVAPDDPDILFTSNIFAVMGLRSLFFLLANAVNAFSLLKYGLAVILSFIGLKMVIAPLYHISSLTSLAVVAGALVLSMAASAVFNRIRS